MRSRICVTHPSISGSMKLTNSLMQSRHSAGLPLLQDMVHRARKCRLLGSAALDMAYVACGRFDAYIEQGISLWDIAAGWLLIETAGGIVDLRPRKDMKDKYSIIASNGVIDLKL